jgi:hypothetical protein
VDGGGLVGGFAANQAPTPKSKSLSFRAERSEAKNLQYKIMFLPDNSDFFSRN